MLTRRIALLSTFLLIASGCIGAASRSFPEPAADIPAAEAQGLQTVVLAGGCFWGVEGVFERIKGVQKAVSGFAGGEKSTAHYEVVSSGRTGHAESVQVTFDPKQISFGQLLMVFFSVVHHPTELNRQGPDSGTQYRSAIFYTTDEQKSVAEAYIKQLNNAAVYSKPIVTQVAALKGFYAAEGYHQHYLDHNMDNPYIVYNDLPKIRALQREFPQLCRR